jgi:hypothetical protein
MTRLLLVVEVVPVLCLLDDDGLPRAAAPTPTPPAYDELRDFAGSIMIAAANYSSG